MLQRVLVMACALGVIIGGVWLMQMRTIPTSFTWGASFSKLHSDELGLDWRDVYEAILTELKVKRMRLSAHWPLIEPERDVYDFSVMDYQMRRAREEGVSVILAVGRKSPGWPECHIPHWVGSMEREEEKREIRQYLTKVVERYKDYPNITYWQIENEPFLHFARHICGEPDEEFYKEELALVRGIDPDTPILATDGGEFGFWYKAHKYADAFAPTMYLYVYTRHIGYWRYPVSPAWFRWKLNMLEWFSGETKPKLSIEVGLEPWLKEPIVNVSLEGQLEKMNMERFEEVLQFARATSFAEHYLWGLEWWYYMREKGHPEFWNRGKELYSEGL